MGHVKRKSFDTPDELREMALASLRLVTLGSLTVGLGRIEPGWRWSTHAKAAIGEPLCQVHHVQMLLAGRFAILMEDGEYTEIEPNEVFEVPPGHDAWVLGDEPAVILDFLGNVDQLFVPSSNARVVTTLLMTDIVDSTATASQLGDMAWKQRLGEHNRLVRSRLRLYKGDEVNTTGDGFLATFAGAQGAIRCAVSIRDGIAEMGMQVRVGVHTGEVEVVGDDIGGVAVHTAARVMALAGPSEVLVSAGTRALVDDADFRFESRGLHELKGLPAALEVFALGD
jgi:class 3 adenylate cyclase